MKLSFGLTQLPFEPCRLDRASARSTRQSCDAPWPSTNEGLPRAASVLANAW
jgi:hypothetical protein